MKLSVRRRTKSRSLSSSTGIWNLAYDANNRPTRFTSEDGQTVIACDYDYMGRRFMKKITIGGSITVHQRYLYRGYLQIAALDLTSSQLPVLSFIHWDPTEASATRPLSIRKNETWYSYGQDLTKNVTELYKADGTIASTYDYSPYGAVTATGTDQPLQWSSEVYDTELGMVYYNYRHYNPRDGRWINRDPIAEQGGWNLYGFVENNAIGFVDYFGLEKCCNKLTHKEVDYDPKKQCCCHGEIIKKRVCKIYISVGCSKYYNPEKFNTITKGKPYIKGSCVTCGRLNNCNLLNEGNRVSDHNKTRNNAWLFPNGNGKYKKHTDYKPERGDTTVQEGLNLELANAKKEAKQMCSNSALCCLKIEIHITSQGDEGAIWLKAHNYERNEIYETIKCH